SFKLPAAITLRSAADADDIIAIIKATRRARIQPGPSVPSVRGHSIEIDPDRKMDEAGSEVTSNALVRAHHLGLVLRHQRLAELVLLLARDREADGEAVGGLQRHHALG